MKTLIAGLGEVGTALYAILSEQYDCVGIEINGEWEANFDWDRQCIDILHISFPYSNNFIQNVKRYQNRFKPKYTVIHSTVPIGTSSKVGALHSPIRGIHPHLEQGIRTFVKMVGGQESGSVADYFRRAGLRVAIFDKPETTEAAKILDTTYYGICIEWSKECKRICDRQGLNFSEVYTLANKTYNEGYGKLGYPEFIRPILEPIIKPIGGHCVLPNLEFIDTKFKQIF